MRIIGRGLVVMALVVVFCGVAYADSVSLFTPPMLFVSTRWACLIVNVGDQTRTVTILVNGEGPGTTKDLAPGGRAVVTASPADPGCTDGGCGVPLYCAFKVQGGKHEFRAAVCAADVTGGSLSCLPAE